MGEKGWLFKHCAYCDLIRLCEFYGRRWLCDACAAEAAADPSLGAVEAEE